jgi:integrase
VFNTALDDGLLGGRNPCDGVRLPRVDSPPIFPMSIDQVDALLAATSEPFKAAIVIGAGLGLRQSEAAGLTVDRVDFLRRSVTIDGWLFGDANGCSVPFRRPRRPVAV